MIAKSSWLAHSANDLERMCNEIDVEVPGRADGRTSDHTERYSIARLLNHLNSDLHFPLMAIHTDKPDFVLATPFGHIGIEHVEAVPENIAEADFLRDKGHGSESWYGQRAKVGEHRKSSKRILKEIMANEPGEAWIGDASERDTADAIIHFANRKTILCLKPEFRRHDKNLLAIYNNWPGAGLNFRKAVELAHPGLVEAGAFSCFDTIAVIDSTEIALISADEFRIEKLKLS